MGTNDRLTLEAWLERLQTLHSQPIELGLKRIAQVAGVLNIHPGRSRVVTVAGTNGKGSVVTAIDGICRAMGWRCGRYMSPHLHDFRERALIQGHWIEESDWLQAFALVEQARGAVSLTYFEYTTLAVLWLFQCAELDLWILEVGLGGRLDAVNIIDADVAVVTSIGLDHTEYLGVDRESIAAEKAGIVRPGGCVVVGDTDPPRGLRTLLNELQADVWWYGSEFKCCIDPGMVEVGAERWLMPASALDAHNVLVALAAVLRLDTHTDKNRMQVVLKAVVPQLYLAGRFEPCPKDRRIIMDVAHNPHGARFLCAQLQRQPCMGATWMVVAMLTDKDRAGTLEALAQVADGFYLAGLNVPRGGTATDLANIAEGLNVPVLAVQDNPVSALQECRYRAAVEDRIVVCGSFYTVAMVREALGMRETENG